MRLDLLKYKKGLLAPNNYGAAYIACFDYNTFTLFQVLVLTALQKDSVMPVPKNCCLRGQTQHTFQGSPYTDRIQTGFLVAVLRIGSAKTSYSQNR